MGYHRDLLEHPKAGLLFEKAIEWAQRGIWLKGIKERRSLFYQAQIFLYLFIFSREVVSLKIGG